MTDRPVGTAESVVKIAERLVIRPKAVDNVPVHAVVEQLEELLQSAKRGDLVAFAYGAVLRAGAVQKGRSIGSDQWAVDHALSAAVADIWFEMLRERARFYDDVAGPKDGD